MPEQYDAVLIVSFGGPEGPDDVIPFLENVLRGKNVPHERMMEVAEHYQHFGGVSPINEQCRLLISALEGELAEHWPHLPIYWGNRNWHPLLTDTIKKMRDDGVQRALAFMTSAYSSYSGCRQYRENIEQAREQIGEDAPVIEKLRVFFNHPGFVQASAERVQDALAQIPKERREHARLLFTAHSIPEAMARSCAYVDQLRDACQLVADDVGSSNWQLVYQSRSGPPTQPWLEPDVCGVLESLQEVQDVVVVPIGFISDHMEVLFDLDHEAKETCQRRGINMVRAATVGTHPKFIAMIRKLILERMADAPRQSLGELGPSHDSCPVDCCLPGRPAGRPAAGQP